MKAKRILSLALAAIFAVSALSGCDWLWWLEQQQAASSSGSSSSSAPRPSHSGSDDDKNNDDSSSSTATPEEPVKVENGTLTVNSTVTELTADMLADIDLTGVTTLDLTNSNVTSIATGNLSSDSSWRNKLKEVHLGSETGTIGGSAFRSCHVLETVTGTPTTISVSAFTGCTNLTTIDLSKVTSIGPGAFLECKSLKSVNVCNVQTIEMAVFSNCTSLQEVYISSSLQTIRDNAFYTSDNTPLSGLTFYYIVKEDENETDVYNHLKTILDGHFGSTETVYELKRATADETSAGDGSDHADLSKHIANPAARAILNLF